MHDSLIIDGSFANIIMACVSWLYCVWVCLGIYVCVCTYVGTYVCAYVLMYVLMYVRTYVCMSTYVRV